MSLEYTGDKGGGGGEKKGEKGTFWEVEGEDFILIPLKLFSC